MVKNKIYNYLKLMRLKHYLKNFLIFFPLIFSGNLFNIRNLFLSIVGFFVFSLVCSIAYIINDIKDKDNDKLHSKKKYRPIACSKITIKEAIILIFVLIVLCISCVICIDIKLYSLFLLFVYLIINILYSFGLKNIALLDIIILAMGFVLRVLFGASIIDVEVSNWLYLTVMAMAFYLALGKRRGEILKSNNTREVLKYYNKEFLDKSMYMCLAIAIVFYSLWTVDVNVMNRINSNLVWTVSIVIIICMRYSMIVENDSDGDPVEVVLHDKFLLLSILFYGLILVGLLYI